MNYAKHYEKLIQRARERVIDGYIERHHIVPRSMGGSNAKANIVRLTPEEHFLAHLLLVKMHPERPALMGALFLMSRSAVGLTQRSNKVYGWLRRKYIEAKKGWRPTPEAIEKARARNLGIKRTDEFKSGVSAFHKGRKRNPETGRRISEAHKVRCRTPEFREKISRIHTGLKRSPDVCAQIGLRQKGRRLSDETKCKMSAAAKGRPKSAETRRRMSEAQSRVQAQKRQAMSQLELTF